MVKMPGWRIQVRRETTMGVLQGDVTPRGGRRHICSLRQSHERHTTVLSLAPCKGSYGEHETLVTLYALHFPTC
jgi:hypothetical protein